MWKNVLLVVHQLKPVFQELYCDANIIFIRGVQRGLRGINTLPPPGSVNLCFPDSVRPQRTLEKKKKLTPTPLKNSCVRLWLFLYYNTCTLVSISWYFLAMRRASEPGLASQLKWLRSSCTGPQVESDRAWCLNGPDNKFCWNLQNLPIQK